MKKRRKRADGERSREVILEAAARLATVEGLHGLSLGRLAEITGMSKSGVFGLFGSKEELQMATIDRAREVFMAEVIIPVLKGSQPGAEMILALCEGFLDYVAKRVWPGGCFFASVAAEVMARPGPVRDRIANEQRQWVDLIRDNARHAIASKQLPNENDPDQLTVELSTMLTGADIAYLLHEDPEILNRIRNTLRARLGSARGK